jgi:fermentation-respiration switch protein FrsA (DUF1100 family)
MGRYLTVFVALAAVLLVLVWITQRRMIYFPFGAVPAPAEIGIDRAELVTLQTEDGLSLGAWFLPARSPASGDAMIVFNGNAGNRAYRAGLGLQIANRGIGVLLFDYRGYGGNPGSPSEEGLARDARAALRYMESRADVDPSRLVYYGESLGAAVAVGLAVDHPPRALILRSPFTSLVDTGRHHYPILPVHWLLRDRYLSLDRITRIRCPLLVIAAADDSIVPTAQSRRLFDAANEPKELLIVEHVDHNDEALAAGGQAMSKMIEFLQRVK